MFAFGPRNPPGTPPPQAAASHRERMAERSRRIHAGLAEIGPLPAVVDPARRAATSASLLTWLTTYFPHSTGLAPFSDDHRRFIARLETAITYGAREIDCVYRGFAKTTIAENAVLWATFTGRHKFVLLLGVDVNAAIANLESLKTEIETNDLLLADWPEVCYPVRALEGKPQRCQSQTLAGQRTRIRWTGNRIVLPYVPGSLGAEAAIETNSLLSCRRGVKHKTHDGQNVRPSFVFIDDPQTDESAHSETQVAKRLAKLSKTVLRLAGHNKTLSVFVAATVIERDDFAHQLLDAEKYPSFRGERIPMMTAAANAHDTFWLGEYSKLRHDFDREDPDDQLRARRAATALYLAHREDADAGCAVSWSECFSRDPDACEVSAIQHAYNILIDDGADVFASECQQDPAEKPSAVERPAAATLARKTLSLRRGMVPVEATTLTAFIDCQVRVLYWAVVAWHAPMTGHVVAAGTFPDQRKDYFSLNQVTRTLRRRFPGSNDDGALYAGLDALTAELAHGWTNPDGTPIKLARGLIDSGYGPHAKIIYRWLRQSPHAAGWLASKGRGITGNDRPVSEWTKRPGDRSGEEWFLAAATRDRPRLLTYDANFWKTECNKSLITPIGTPRSLTLYHGSAAHHRMISEHATAESADVREGRDRTAIVWSLPTTKPDNHLGDCLVGCMVGASLEGVHLADTTPPARPRKRARRRFSRM